MGIQLLPWGQEAAGDGSGAQGVSAPVSKEKSPSFEHSLHPGDPPVPSSSYMPAKQAAPGTHGHSLLLPSSQGRLCTLLSYVWGLSWSNGAESGYGSV